jgi:iron complex transport system substrate-binding protein
MKVTLLALVLLAALFTALAVACDDDDDEDDGADATDAPKATETADFPLTLTDDAGAEVTVEEEPERIVALAPSFVEVLFAVDAGERVVAVDENSDYPAEVASLPKLSGFDPSVEAIVAEEPDLVLIQFDPGGLTDALEASDVTVVTLASPEDMEGVYKQINTIGRLSGHADEATDVVSVMREDVADVVATIPEGIESPSVFHEVDNTLYSVGPGSFIHDIYVILLAENVAADAGSAYPQLNNEAVIAANPDVIILADEEFGETLETVAARPGWSTIAAVQSGRVHGVAPDLISRPGPRLPETITS